MDPQGTRTRAARTAAGAAAVVAAAALALAGCHAAETQSASTSASGGAKGGTAAPSASPSPTSTVSQDPTPYAPIAAREARAAGIDPKLLMAILYNEDYKPHGGDVERAWQKWKPDASFGIANMHKAAFEETRANHPKQLGGSSWDRLPDDPKLAVTAAAWFLHDLRAQLPSGAGHGRYTADELLALGYNGGAGTMRAVAAGSSAGPQVSSYLDKLKQNWPRAQKALGSQ
ncbi:hypothetical protein BIV57_18305 [Mangrovactinospora gilvigrisea]|uniref:Transglycosylase SLT domain-containing protein n=1 Tax=Mangrovactinospora gilvigrisea TaxID=1428644 RepID=A0A1J7C3D3_9ACTN|nr:hypothetical protein [Mangrovactinospora gilvigrisea]OIV36060.1 hypothetical protein BIV57_18305 [Mangrovactinospora gilvigrisea]